MYTAECYKDSVASFMVGYSDSKAAQMLVSNKDDGSALNLSPLEFKLFVREFDDRRGCQIKGSNSNSDDKEEDREGSEVHQREDEEDQVKSQKEKQEDNFDMFASSLKVKIPSAEESRGLGDEDEDEGMKTPTSLDQKIIVSLKSPPGAPRKPKALPLKKRKANRQPRLLLDLSREIELLFPPVVCADQLGGDKIKKKSRQESSS